MSSKFFRPVACAIGALLTVGAVSDIAKPTRTPVTARLSESLDLRAALLTFRPGQDPSFHAAAATDRGLRFLVMDGSSHQWSVVLTDPRGAVQSQTNLPGRYDYSGIAADNTGRIVVYQPEPSGPGHFVTLRDHQTASFTVTPAPKPVYTFSSLPDHFVSLLWNGNLDERDSRSADAATFPSSLAHLTPGDGAEPYLLRPLTTNQFAIADQAHATLTIHRFGDPVGKPITLHAPEIDRARALIAQEQTTFRAQARPGDRLMTEVILWGIASRSNGDLYVGVRPAPVSDGEAVLRFDREGHLLQRLRCPSPADFGAQFFGISRNRLMLADAQGRVAFYEL